MNTPSGQATASASVTSSTGILISSLFTLEPFPSGKISTGFAVDDSEVFKAGACASVDDAHAVMREMVSKRVSTIAILFFMSF